MPATPAKPAARPVGNRPAPPPPVEEEEEALVEEEPEAGAEEETTGEMAGYEEPEADTGFEDDEDNEEVDLSGVSEKTTVMLLKPGIWDGYVEEVQFSHSQNSGNPMWTWICVIEYEVEGKDGPETRERRQYYHTVWNNEAGQSRIKRAIRRLKLDTEQGGAVDLAHINPRRDCDNIAGVPARFRIRNRKYEGEFRNNVVDILPPKEESEVEGAV